MAPLQRSAQRRSAGIGLLLAFASAGLFSLGWVLPPKAAADVTALTGLSLTLVFLIAPVYLGRSAAARTGRAGSGALPGLLVNVLGSLGAFLAFLHGELQRQADLGLTKDISVVITFALTEAIVVAFFAAACGAGLGAIGGLIGRGRRLSTREPQPGVEALPQPIEMAAGSAPTSQPVTLEPSAGAVALAARVPSSDGFTLGVWSLICGAAFPVALILASLVLPDAIGFACLLGWLPIVGFVFAIRAIGASASWLWRDANDQRAAWGMTLAILALGCCATVVSSIGIMLSGIH